MGLNLDLRIGTSRTWQLQALNPDDSVPTGLFLDTDVLNCSVWRGSDQLPILNPDIAWLSSTDATFAITFHDLDTVGIARGVYYIGATAIRGADSADLLPRATTLTLLDAPGLATPRPTYITAIDIRRIASWIDDIVAPGNETGYADQCADAREWLDECILRNYRGGNVTPLGYHGMALDAWFTGGTRRTSLHNPFILNTLRFGPAMVTPPTPGLIVTGRTRDICSYYAVHRIMEGMITRGNQYPSMSARMLHKAHQLLSSYTAELSVGGAVDYAGSLIGNIPINFSSTATLYA